MSAQREQFDHSTVCDNAARANLDCGGSTPLFKLTLATSLKKTPDTFVSLKAASSRRSP
jgi:hypothetical protein